MPLRKRTNPFLHAKEPLSENLKKRIVQCRETSWGSHGKRIVFYAPTFAAYSNRYHRPTSQSFQSISTTGTRCALQCEHCKARFLEAMIPATTPQDLWKTLADLKKKGSVGCLISGGCRSDGAIQLTQFLPIIAKAKAELGLKLVVHTGIVSAESSKRLAESGVDSALIDVIGSQETVNGVCHLDIGIEAYEDSLAALSDSGVKVVPHVLVGLHYGRLKGEHKALAMIARHNPAAVVLIALTPLRGTGMGSSSPPSACDILTVLIKARELMPHVPLVLGCARPTGNHRSESEILGIKAGVNGIAFPTVAAIQLAKEMGIQHRFFPWCCSLIYEDLTDSW